MFVADLHNDVLQRAINGEDIINKTSNGHSDIERLIEAKINLEVFVIWITKQYLKYSSFNRANELINKLEEIERKSQNLTIVRSYNDIISINKKSHLAAAFGIEGGECLENSLDNLDHFIKKGLLYLGPTWNNSNLLATSAYDETHNLDKINSLGLTNFGKDAIKICEDSGVLIDVSHIGEKSFWDILKLSKKGIIASHSCVYSLCKHYRNLKDDQILALKKNEGVIFINLYPGFIDSDFESREKKIKLRYAKELDNIDLTSLDPDKRWISKQNFIQKKLNLVAPTLDKYIDHIEYIIKLAGIDFVGIGSDYDGMDCLPNELEDCTNHMLIAKKLEKRGYSNNDIEKVMGLNFLRIYQSISY